MTPSTPGTPHTPDQRPTAPTLDEPSTGQVASLPETVAPAGTARREASPAPSAATGSRYRPLRPLGQGGLGEVFVAQDEEVNREVALKEIRATHADSADNVGRFLLEAEVTGRLEHPGVVPVYGLGRHADGRPYYAMRLIKGETLQDALTRFYQQDKPHRAVGERRLAFRDLLRRFTDVCNAVAYAHSKGVLHRDLKPANIMLGPFGETLIVDWGLAKVLGATEGATSASGVLLPGASASSTQAGAVVGTPTYMSPEQAAGHNLELTAATDIYSLGAILYALLTGRGPFDTSTNIYTVLGQVRKGEFIPPRGVQRSVPAALEAICLKAMALTPEARYVSAKDLAADVDHWLGDEPVTAYREPLAARVRRWGRRHRSFVSAVAALVLTLTVALGVGLALVQAEEARTRAALADKNIEATKARAAAERAEKAEKASRIALGSTSAAAARLSAQRGQWEEALNHYRQALQHEPEDEIALRLGLLECYMARYEFRFFREELARLAERQDLGTHRGEVRLQEALDATFSARKNADPQKLLREALDLGLPPAEEAYARALMAPTVPEVVEHLQRTVRLDPFHRRAQELLPGMLFLLGHVPEMRAAVAQLHLISPGAFTTTLWQASVLMLDGNLEAAYRECERLRPSMGADGMAVVRLMLRVLDTMNQSEIAWQPNEKRLAILADVLGTAPHLARLFQDNNQPDEAERWADFAMFRLPALQPLADHPAFQTSGNPAQLLAMLQPKVMSEVAGRLAETCPNGMFIWAHSTWLRNTGRLVEAEAALCRALRTPSTFPIYRLALFDLTNLQFERLAKVPPELRPHLQGMIRANLHDLAGRGVYPAEVNQQLAYLARSVDEPALALVFSNASVRQAPANDAGLRSRFESELAVGAYARAVNTTNEMLAKAPADATLVNQRVVLEYRQGAVRAALASTFEVLRLDPNHLYALGNLQAIEDRLKERRAQTGALLEKVRLRQPLQLAHAGAHARVDDVLRELVKDEKPSGDTLVALSCIHAQTAAAAARDKSLTAEKRQTLVEKHAAEAVAILLRAKEAGYFNEPLHVSFLDGERDLDPVRMRPDFQQFLAAVRKKN